jgi:hypothetical protein
MKLSEIDALKEAARAAVDELRPGDFVTVEIAEPPLEGVAVIPASAVTEDGRALVIGADDRLEEVRVRILRRRGAEMIVDDAPFGRLMVAERLPQLGAGVKVRVPRPPGAAEDPGPSAAAGDAGPARLAAAGEDETVALDPARRDRLIRFVRGAEDMEEERRARALEALSRPAAPRALVERLEARMGG